MRMITFRISVRYWKFLRHPPSIILLSHIARADLLSDAAGKLTRELLDIKSEGNITSIR